MGRRPPVALEPQYTRIEISTTRRWFNCSLSKQFIHLLLNNGIMSSSHLDIKLAKLQNKEDRTKAEDGDPNNIKHKSVRCNASSLIKNLKIIPTWKTADEDVEEAEEHDTSGVLTPTDPFPPSISRTGGDTATSRLLATWMRFIPTHQVRPLSQRQTTRPWHRSLLHHEMEASLWPGLATPHRRKRLRQTHGRLVLSLCQTPANMAIQAGLTRRNHIHETVKKRELWSPDLMTLPGYRIKHMLKYKQSSQLIWKQHCPKCQEPWSNSHTLDTGIMPPSELGREERVSRRVTLRREASCSVSRVAWAAAPKPVCKSDRDWSAFLFAEVNVMLSGEVSDWNPKATGWLEKLQINLDADILVTRGTGAKRALAWCHNLKDLMLGASCSLELSERVLTKQRNPKENEDVMASDSSKEGNQWGWNPSHFQSQPQPGPGKE